MLIIIKRVERVDFMGFWYLLLLTIGIVLIIIGLTKIRNTGAIKTVVTLFIFGVLVSVVSVLLLMPGSSEVIADFLNLQ